MAIYQSNNSGGYYTTLNVWEKQKDVANNRTLIGYDWRFYQNGNRSNKSTVRELWINGNRLYYQADAFNTQAYPFRTNFSITSGELWIYHDNNGKKTIALGSTVNGLYKGGLLSMNASMTLSDIPRQAEILTAPEFNDEENPSITYKNPLGSRVNALEVCISFDGEKPDIPYRAVPLDGNSYQFDLTEDERNILRKNIHSSLGNLLYFVMKTTYGGKVLYSKMQTRIRIINAGPIFEGFTYRDANTNTAELTGGKVLIKDYSNLEVVIDKPMEGRKFGVPSHYWVEINGQGKATSFSATAPQIIEVGKLNFSGKKRLIVKAIDRRICGTDLYKDIDIIDYKKPKIYATLERKNNFEKETTLKISGIYDEIKVGGAAKNQLNTLKYRYREKNGIWGSWTNVTFTLDNGNFKCNDIILNIDNGKAFDFEIYAEDKLANNTTSLELGAGIPAFFISSNKKSIGVNCIPPDTASEGSIWYKSGNTMKQVLDYEIVDTW